MNVSKKQLASAKKYHQNFDDIKVRVPIGNKDYWKNEAKKRNKSLNQFIIDCVEEEIKKGTQ